MSRTTAASTVLTDPGAGTGAGAGNVFTGAVCDWQCECELSESVACHLYTAFGGIEKPEEDVEESGGESDEDAATGDLDDLDKGALTLLTV